MHKQAKIKIILSVFLIFVVLTSSVYFLLPDKVRIDIENTRTKYSVWEDGWNLAAIEYVNLYDGTTKMRAKSRELIYWNDSFAYTKRVSIWKDNITTIQTYKFDINTSNVEQFPVSNEFECFNCEGKIVHYEIRDILYDGETKIITSPFSFGYNMKIEWQEEYDWAKVYQQIVSDKIIIRYRPKETYEKYSVRLFDPKKPKKYSQSYDEETKTMTIKESGLELARIKLDSPQVKYVIRGKDRLVAEFTVNNQKQISKFVDKLELYDENNKSFERNFTLRYKEFYSVEVNDYETICSERNIITPNGTEIIEKYNCSENFTGSHFEERFNWIDFNNSLKIGKTTIGIFTDVYDGESVEWIPTFINVRVPQWATWTESLSVGLNAYYKLDETSGVVVDELGLHNGVNSGAVRGVGGKINTAFLFNDTDSVDALGTPMPTGNDARSISFWIYGTLTGNYSYPILKSGNLASAQLFSVSIQDRAGQKRIYVQGYNRDIVSDDKTLDDNTWYHIAVTYDGSTLANVTLYINAVDAGHTSDQDALTFATGTNTQGLGINDHYSSFGDNILVDEIGMWNRSLTASEVSDLYNGGDGMTYGVDETPPNVTINTPLNQTYDTNTITFNITVINDILIDSCLYSLDSGVTNYSMTNISSEYTATNSTMAQGSHTANFYCNDSSNNINDSESVTFVIDTIYPIINMNYPENKTYIINVTKLNYTYIEVNCDSVWYSLNSGATNSSREDCGTNWTGLTSVEGSNVWIVYINDSEGNENQSSVTFFVDSINPDILIIYPTNNTYNSNNELNVNYTRSDINLDSCWYSNDTYSINITLTDCTNITTVNWSEGQHNVTVWANDTLNNVNSSSVTFYIDTIYPEVCIIYPANTTYSFTVHDLNYTYTDLNPYSCWYSKDGGTTNSSTQTCGTNWTNLNASWGGNVWIVYINDSAGNENFTSITFSVRTFLFLNGVEQSLDAEFGTQINVSSNNSLGEVFFDIIHPQFGINYTTLSSFLFNVSYFVKNLFSDDSSSKTFKYTNSSSYDVYELNISSHQYDEADYLSVNISGDNNPEDIAFYKVNTTNFDRAYDGFLIGTHIYLNETFDNQYSVNLTFSNPGSQIIYFYLDDNIDIFNFTLNVSGSLYGFEFNDSFENWSYMNLDSGPAQLDLSGIIMPPNSSFAQFVYDDFEDGTIDTDSTWDKTSDFSYGETCSYSGAISETNGYIQMLNYWSDAGDSCTGTITLQLGPNSTNLNMYATDYIEFNLSNDYVSSADNFGCGANLRVYAGNTLLWTSMFLDGATGGTEEESQAENMVFHLTKVNTTSWKCNITGDEYSDVFLSGTGLIRQWYNWTKGTWTKDTGGSWTYGSLDSEFYFDVTYEGLGNYVLFENKFTDTSDCVSGSQTTKISYINNSKWKRTNGSIQSNSVFDSAGDIADATLTAYGYSAPGEVLNLFMSADDVTNWESVGSGVKHSFSNPGKHIRWMVNFTNVTNDWLNKTSYITYIEINTTQSNPSNITLDFGNEGATNYTIDGILNSSNLSITVDLSNHDLTNAFTLRRSLYDHAFKVPLVVYSDTKGLINLNVFNLTYNPNPVILNVSSLQTYLDNGIGYTNFSIPVGTYSGNITFGDLRYYYIGGNKTYEVLAHNTDYTSNQSFNITYFYSSFYKNLPYTWTEHILFMPSTNSSKNISAYGQTSSIPIFNITTTNYGGRNLNFSIRVNESFSCLNLTWNATGSTKPINQKINTSWKEIIFNLEYLNNSKVWLWADLENCNPSNKRILNPLFYIKSYCKGCVWEDI